MIRIWQIIRLFQIYLVLLKHTFISSVMSREYGFFHFLSYLNPFSFYKRNRSRGKNIRLTLESLGPIFVKFGQLLSTRRDLLADDMIEELSKLQDQVPPFPGKKAVAIIEQALGKKIDELFSTFDSTPLASASIAQVHAATLHSGEDIIVKVIRPTIKKIIRHDIANLYFVARLVERFWSQGKRLHPVALVAEFEKTIIDELDLLREAGNASQLRRNFEHSNKIYVPKIYWSYTCEQVMAMERIYGIPIADIATLKQRNANMKKLAEYGVEIFFTQVFRDSFFHADMHPGNLFVDLADPNNPKYIGVDFGIMGSLNPQDQHYLAENIYAFFTRDYRRIAQLHIDSGWVPADTRVDEFESAIRTVCEPIFSKPLSEISFGLVLLRLFRTAERFHMEIQPQLMLLQKTLLSIEGLGRMLYPELDLWETAKPFMRSWIRKRRGVLRLGKQLFQEYPQIVEKTLKTPELLFNILSQIQMNQRLTRASETTSPKKTTSTGWGFALGVLVTLVVISALLLLKQSF